MTGINRARETVRQCDYLLLTGLLILLLHSSFTLPPSFAREVFDHFKCISTLNMAHASSKTCISPMYTCAARRLQVRTTTGTRRTRGLRPKKNLIPNPQLATNRSNGVNHRSFSRKSFQQHLLGCCGMNT